MHLCPYVPPSPVPRPAPQLHGVARVDLLRQGVAGGFAVQPAWILHARMEGGTAAGGAGPGCHGGAGGAGGHGQGGGAGGGGAERYAGGPSGALLQGWVGWHGN